MTKFAFIANLLDQTRKRIEEIDELLKETAPLLAERAELNQLLKAQGEEEVPLTFQTPQTVEQVLEIAERKDEEKEEEEEPPKPPEKTQEDLEREQQTLRDQIDAEKAKLEEEQRQQEAARAAELKAEEEAVATQQRTGEVKFPLNAEKLWRAPAMLPGQRDLIQKMGEITHEQFMSMSVPERACYIKVFKVRAPVMNAKEANKLSEETLRQAFRMLTQEYGNFSSTEVQAYLGTAQTWTDSYLIKPWLKRGTIKEVIPRKGPMPARYQTAKGDHGVAEKDKAPARAPRGEPLHIAPPPQAPKRGDQVAGTGRGFVGTGEVRKLIQDIRKAGGSSSPLPSGHIEVSWVDEQTGQTKRERIASTPHASGVIQDRAKLRRAGLKL